MDFDEHVEGESEPISPEDVLNGLNEKFETVMTLLDGIKQTFVEQDEEEGRDEIVAALDHVMEAWSARNRKLYELSAEPT